MPEVQWWRAVNQKLTSTDGRRWAFLSRYDILDEIDKTKVYLRRWRIIMTPYGGLYVHKIMMSDGARPLHNHPYWFIGWIICGGYTEERPDGMFTLRRWRWRLMRRTALHAIRKLTRTPTWTVLITGPRRQDFGYDTAVGIIRHKDVYSDG